MYICLCNCLRESDLRGAIESGAGSAAEVFETLGHQPQCGGCLDFAQHMIDEILAEQMQRAS